MRGLILFSLLVGSAFGAGLSGSVSTSVTTSNLTTEGTQDWEHWGYGGGLSPDHKNVTSLLSNYTVIGGGTPATFTNAAIAYDWTDGTPNTSVTATTTGIYIVGINKGFTFTAPADTTTRVLKVYVGAFNTTLHFTAHLSDSSASDYTDTSITNGGGAASTDGVYTLTYSAASSSQTLTITYTIPTSPGNVNLQAASLSSVPGPDFTIGVSPSSRGVAVGGSNTFTVSIAALSGYAGTVSFSTSGLPGTITPGFSPTTVTTSGSTTLTVTASGLAAPGTYPFTITGTDGTNTHSTGATVLIADFSLGLSPSAQAVNAGAAATYTLTVTATGGFAGTTSFAISGLPGTITSGFSPTTVTGTGSTTLTLTTTGGTAASTYAFTITVTSGTLSHTITGTLSVVTMFIGSHNACLQAAGTTTVTCTLTSVVAGSTIVAHGITDNSTNISSITDNQSTPCTYVEFPVSNIDWNFQADRERAFYCQNITTTGNVTLTLTAAGTGASKLLFVAELVGAKTFGAVLDKSSSAVVVGCSGNCIATTAVSTAQADELIIVAGCPNAAATITAGTGFTMIATLASSFITCGHAYRILTSLGTYEAQLNLSGAYPRGGALSGTFIAQPLSASRRKASGQ